MKRLALALAVVGLVACKKAENGTPATDSTAAPAAAPAPAMDSSKMMMNDSASAMPADTAKMGMKKGS
jgi:hypothetical protein